MIDITKMKLEDWDVIKNTRFINYEDERDNTYDFAVIVDVSYEGKIYHVRYSEHSDVDNGGEGVDDISNDNSSDISDDLYDALVEFVEDNIDEVSTRDI